MRLQHRLQMFNPGHANLPIGFYNPANQEIGVPRGNTQTRVPTATVIDLGSVGLFIFLIILFNYTTSSPKTTTQQPQSPATS